MRAALVLAGVALCVPGPASAQEESADPTAPPGFALVPAGEFLMGSPPGEAPHRDHEAQHRVVLTRPFWIQIAEVTGGEWRALMGSDAAFSATRPELPMELSWWDALAFANARSESEDLAPCYTLADCTGELGSTWVCADVVFAGLSCPGYRLPTEAEWEYACRAGTTDALYGPIAEIAWTALDSGYFPHPGMQKAPNAWGLYDMLGNVWEWVWDWAAPFTPADATDPVGPESGTHRVYRGGGASSLEIVVRAAHRAWWEPDRRPNQVGFRLVRTAE